MHNQTPEVPHYDIAIVGAGIAGSALAVALTNKVAIEVTGQQLNVALIEAADIPDAMPPSSGDLSSYDLRASALTYNTIDWLACIDVWQEVAAARTGCFDSMRVWVEQGTGSIEFTAQDAGVDRLGEVVENRLLVAALQRHVGACEHCHLMTGAGVEAITALPSTASQSLTINRLTLANGQKLDADLVVAADGARSAMRELIDMPVREWDYGHDALVCNVKMERPHNRCAIQRFTQTGPVAFLPLGEHSNDAAIDSEKSGFYCTVVWSQTRERAQALMQMEDSVFAEHLAGAIENQLGAVEQLSARVAFPLQQRHAKDYVKDGVVLIADAAHTIHPLAGQGINLGLMDVSALTKTILESLAKYRIVANEKLLRRFQRERKAANLSMMAAVEGFKWIYQPMPLPVTLLRNRAMSMLDSHTLIKSQVVQYAMGPQASLI